MFRYKKSILSIIPSPNFYASYMLSKRNAGSWVSSSCCILHTCLSNRPMLYLAPRHTKLRLRTRHAQGGPSRPQDALRSPLHLPPQIDAFLLFALFPVACLTPSQFPAFQPLARLPSSEQTLKICKHFTVHTTTTSKIALVLATVQTILFL